MQICNAKAISGTMLNQLQPKFAAKIATNEKQYSKATARPALLFNLKIF